MSATKITERCTRCGTPDGRHGQVHTRHGNGGGSNRPCPNHDARCISLTDSEFNAHCDCPTWWLIYTHGLLDTIRSLGGEDQ